MPTPRSFQSKASEDGTNWFLNAAGRTPLLTAEREVLYGRRVQEWMAVRDIENPTPAQRRIQKSGKRAYDAMFKANTRLVVVVAKKYTKLISHLEMLDLIQEGSIGLARAIEKFDPSLGYKFSTYAYWWIRQGITRAISQQERTVRLPINAIEMTTKLCKFKDQYMQEHGTEPNLTTCAEFLGTSPEQLRKYLMHSQRATSLDNDLPGRSHSGGREGGTILECIADETPIPVEELELKEGLDNLYVYLDTLNDQERSILEHRYGLYDGNDWTLSGIGEKLNLSRERVRQIHNRALRKIQIRTGNGPRVIQMELNRVLERAA